MPVSQDFKDSMRLLHMEVQKLQRENVALRKEFDVLKKTVEKSDEINVRKKDDVIKRAAISGDVAKIEGLASDANSVVQDEILRQSLPLMGPTSIQVTQIRGDLVDNFINAFVGGEVEKFPFTVKDKPKPSTIDKSERMYTQLRNNTQRMLQQSMAEKERIAKREQQYLQQQKEHSNALARFSPAWETELDK